MRGKLALSTLLALSLFAATPARAEAGEISPKDLRPALEELLREHPEVLLDFLREHCETVLDIAQMGSDSKKLSNLEKQWAQDAKIPKDAKTENRPRVGLKNAKVQIVAFSDFTCTYCRRAERTVEQLIKEYSGKVSFVFKNMPLDPQGIAGLASQYFVAISQQSEEKAWKFYRLLFDNYDKLIGKGEEYLREAAMEIGVDMKKMDSARRQKLVARILKEDLDDADRLGIEGTPCFLVNNLVIRGAVPINMFRRAIEIELNR